MTRRIFYTLCCCLLLLSCGQKNLDLPNFDEPAWQADKDGCNNVRLEMRDDLIKVKDQLKALNGDDVISLLGKPNITNLTARNQKYFLYNITCDDQAGEPSTLSIRFSAIGLSYEVLVY